MADSDTTWQAWYGERRFAVLLVLLLGLVAGPPVLGGFGLAAAWFDLVLTLLLVTAVLSLCFDRRQRLFALLLGVPTLLLSVGGLTLPGEAGTGARFAGQVCVILFFFGAAILVVRALFTIRPLTLDSVFGAACGYLFLGLAWAVLYSLVEDVRPGSFQVSPALAAEADSAHRLPHVLTYYSFVTLTTVGCGDVTPVAPAARTFAWLEALTGQFYLAVIVAGLVSVLAAREERSDAP